MKYAYYPGCSLHATAKEFDMSTKATFKGLGIGLEEAPDWVCCGASSAHATSELLSHVLPAKTLAAVDRDAKGIVVPCIACYSRFRTTNAALREDPELRANVESAIGVAYEGEIPVRHPLDVIVNDFGLDAVKEKVSKELTDLRVVSYYGCLLTRPPELASFDDDPENPTSMDDLVTALGADAVDWPYKTDCCGASLSFTRTDIAMRLSRDILAMAADADADCIAVACPMCQSNLDLRQRKINQTYGTSFDIPIIYITQLTGLALGATSRELGLHLHSVNPKNLLKKKALA
ncbi:MAG: CoB--CoM heterodisulfide reductase iron-sulfur subunit B family protein [Lentisphaerae bacterium]|nr:CoB--CoM heterodisulfide reductase iron-sulfur subunit B family protein [Lentisphaerota bacterium]